jgi:hypothetical protein
MDKQAITDLLTNKYSLFVNYINSLTAEEYNFSYQQKWTAGQQLGHIALCVKPLVQVYSMDKPIIEQSFGRTDREKHTYEGLLNIYLEKLKEGGKAPARFLPENVPFNERETLCEILTKMIKELNVKIETFNEEELDTLLIPHPLLEKLTLREMLYNAIYHVTHHQNQAIQHLENK